MRALTLNELAFLCAMLTLAPSSSLHAAAMKTSIQPDLSQRDSSSRCSQLDSSLTLCSNVDFCCPTTSTCVPLDQGLSVICCPAGASCNFIKPISCDTAQQNETLYPLAPIHSSNLSLPMPRCLDSCCPLGFTCQNGLCARDGSARNSTTLPSSPTPVVPTIISTNIPDATAMAAASSCKQFPAPAVITGLLVGVFVGAVLAILIQYLLRRYQQKKEKKNRYSADFMGQTPAMDTVNHPRSSDERHMIENRPKLARSAISDPMAAPTFGAIHRTDFLVRRDSAQSSMASHSAKPSYSSSKSTTAVDTLASTTYTAPLRMPMPQTPEGHMRNKSNEREPQLFLTPLHVGLPANPAAGPNPLIRSQSKSPGRAATPGKSPYQTPNSNKSPDAAPTGSKAHFTTPSTVTTGTPVTITASTLSPQTTSSARTPLKSPHCPRPSPARQQTKISQSSSHTSSIIQDDSDGGVGTRGELQRNNSQNESAIRPERKSSLASTTPTPSRTREPSTETINVLMPAPDFEESRAGSSGVKYSPYHPGLKDYWGHVSTQTTFSAMMEGARAWQPRTDGRTPPRR